MFPNRKPEGGATPPPISPGMRSPTAVPPANENFPAVEPPRQAPSGKPARPARPILLDEDPLDPLQGSVADQAASADLFDQFASWLYQTPAWLVSMVTHLVLFLVLAILAIQLPQNSILQLDAVFSDRSGEQLEIETFETGSLLDAPESVLVVDNELPPVDIPLAAPEPLKPSPNATSQEFDMTAPVVGLALSGREEGQKHVLLKAFGGNAATENAVQMGLEWLAKNQRRDGSWSLSGPYKDGCSAENRIAATAMAMLAFQGAGHTHRGGTYRDNVNRAWKWLAKQQETRGKQRGSFYKARNAFFRGVDNHTFYSNGMATMAVCELYAMTGDEPLKYPAQMAIDYLIANQNPDGGWRYIADTESDTSVTGWIVMALQSAKMGGLNVPDETLLNIGEFLNSVMSDYGSRYAYQVGQVDTLSMTAEALLCRQYLGWPRDHQPLLTGTKHLLDNPIETQEPNLYYWYYATQVLHHMEGDLWKEWNLVLRDKIPKQQETAGKERGSWPPHNDRWAEYAGRLFSTCFNIYMLEVYYRHLPIYSSVYE